MSFGYVRISTGDYLKIGYGWDSSNASAVVVTYGSYNGYPLDLFFSPANIFMEFDASPTSETYGFQLNLAVRNLSGGLWLYMAAPLLPLINNNTIHKKVIKSDSVNFFNAPQTYAWNAYRSFHVLYLLFFGANFAQFIIRLNPCYAKIHINRST